MERNSKILIEHYSEDVMRLLRKSVKYKGSLDSWLRNFKSSMSLPTGSPELYHFAAAKLFRLDKKLSGYVGSEKTFLAENDNLFKEMEQYSKKLKMLSQYKDGITVITPTLEFVEENRTAGDKVKSIIYSASLFDKYQSFVVPLVSESRFDWPELNSNSNSQKQVSEIYFTFMDSETQRFYYDCMEETSSREVYEQTNYFERIIQISVVSSEVEAGRLTYTCDDYYFPMTEGEELFTQLYWVLYESEYLLKEEELIRIILNLTMNVALCANERLPYNTSSLSMHNLLLNL